MQAQDTPTMFLLKLWPWIEANRQRLAIGTGIIAIVVFGLSFWNWERGQKEISAGKALTQLSLTIAPGTTASQLADLYLKVAGDYPGTLAADRALLQGAATLFEAGRFPDAQTQFQKYLDAQPDGIFSATAKLGVAASLEMQGKMDLAVAAYQKVSGGSVDAMAMSVAKFALGRISEQQGKLPEALNFYQDAARVANPNSSLSSEAKMRASEINIKLGPTKSVAAPTAAPIEVKP